MIQEVTKLKRQKYSINENIFEKINSPEKAYLLGWLISDGYVNGEKGKSSIRIQIQERDLDVLFKLRDIFGSNSPIRKVIYEKEGQENWVDQMRLDIHNKKCVQDLYVLGITANKSKKIILPEIDNNLVPYLIRGIFEGDGCFCVGTTQKGYLSTQWYICSASEKFIDKIIDIFDQILNIDLVKKKNKWNVFYAKTNGAQKIKKIMSWIYNENLNLCMNRKFNYWKNFEKMHNERMNTIKTCSLCNNKHWAKDYCKKHYWQYWKYGDAIYQKKGNI